MSFLNKMICCDSIQGLKAIQDDTVTLVCTSPPYANTRKTYPGPSAFEFVNWILPYCREVLRILKDDGSFIINIQDKVEKGERIPYAFDLVLNLRSLGFKFIDTIIWVKKNGAKNSGKRRANYFEYIFHLAKTTSPVWNEDSIRTPYAPSSIKRAQNPIKNNVSNREGRLVDKKTSYKIWNLNPLGSAPKNVQYFPKDHGKNHVASYHIDLPTHFIKAHSNENDIVVDIFAGRGTTLEAARQLNRRYIGFEINEKNALLAKELYDIEVQL